MAADILIVDDEADIRELIAGILQDEGYETRLAHNSDAALTEVNQRRPSLIILDIWLQGSKLDGLDLLQAIKEYDANKWKHIGQKLGKPAKVCFLLQNAATCNGKHMLILDAGLRAIRQGALSTYVISLTMFLTSRAEKCATYPD